jgi:hypothetical protein
VTAHVIVVDSACQGIDAVDEDRVGVVVGQRLRRRREGGSLRCVISFMVMAAGAVVMMVPVVMVARVIVAGWVYVDVRVQGVAGGLASPVAVGESGPLRQQDGRHQEQAHDTLHGFSSFDNLLPSSLADVPVLSISAGLLPEAGSFTR